MVGSLPKLEGPLLPGCPVFLLNPGFDFLPFGRGGIYARAILWSSPFPDVLGWLGKTVEQTL